MRARCELDSIDTSALLDSIVGEFPLRRWRRIETLSMSRLDSHGSDEE